MHKHLIERLNCAHPSLGSDYIENVANWLRQPNCHLVSMDDEYYPPLLREMSDPPPLLYVRGEPAILASQQIAVVGSRRASPVGIRNAEAFAAELARQGYVITSGLAKGIDAASHRAAMRTGKTIAVMGTGQQRIYPREHAQLAEQIVAGGGAVVTEFPLHMAPHAACFPQRNRIISGLALGTLVVEAALKSGSLITARIAAEQGREVFALPGSIHHVQAHGCHYLIRQGAKLVESVADILEELGALKQFSLRLERRGACSEKKESKEISIEYLQLLEQIEYAVTPLDEIILSSGLTAAKVSSMLLALEMFGYVQSVPGGYMRISPA